MSTANLCSVESTTNSFTLTQLHPRTCLIKQLIVIILLTPHTVAAGRHGHAPRGWAGSVQGAAFVGAKIWNSEIVDELAFALQNGFGGNMHYIITPQLSVLFVTVHTNAIVVTIRVSIADLIGRGGNTDICPGRQTPLRRH